MCSAMSRRVRCSVPIGTDRHCNGSPAAVRFPGNLPTCEANAHVITGTQDIENGAAPLCDFCTNAQPVALYAAAAFYARDTATGPMAVPASWWGACQVCAAAIDAGDLDGLERQWATAHRRDLAAIVINGGPQAGDVTLRRTRALHSGFLGSRDPARPALRYSDWDGSLAP
jgi:hypothetical protein